MKFGFMKGQGATEYLVLLAVVLIIALVSIALLGFFPGLAGDARKTQSDSYWRGEARPFAILEHSLAAATHSLSLVVQNVDSDSRTLFIVSTNGSTTSNSRAGNYTSTGNLFAGGEKKSITMTLVSTCSGTVGATYDVPLNFSYNSTDLAGQWQLGGKNLIGKCA